MELCELLYLLDDMPQRRERTARVPRLHPESPRPRKLIQPAFRPSCPSPERVSPCGQLIR
jgi:hypothetical protein